MAFIFNNQLTNDDILVQDKARHFADFFKFTYTNYDRFGYLIWRVSGICSKKLCFDCSTILSEWK